jgi:hypothetical protein
MYERSSISGRAHELYQKQIVSKQVPETFNLVIGLVG